MRSLVKQSVLVSLVASLLFGSVGPALGHGPSTRLQAALGQLGLLLSSPQRVVRQGAPRARPARARAHYVPRTAPTSGWPSLYDYARAMRHGEEAIRDRRLAGARIEKDRRNEEPLFFSGSFSSVYKLRTQSGRKIAMRVFHPPKEAEDRADMQAWEARYLQLGRFFEQLEAKKRVPPEIIDFAWVAEGIRINGQTLPIMKLPWLDGRSLDQWIERRLKERRPRALATLADNWRAAMRDLAAIKVAHGDLHHGNVMMENGTGRMRFIDYDAMYAPPLAGFASSEIGHPNYQHPSFHFPKPRVRPYDHRMDRFSSLVIYLSLVALADDPSLWRRYHDEHKLIFEAKDFLDPVHSSLFAELRRAANPQVRALASQLAKACTTDPGDAPSLEQALSRSGRECREHAKPWYAK